MQKQKVQVQEWPWRRRRLLQERPGLRRQVLLQEESVHPEQLPEVADLFLEIDPTGARDHAPVGVFPIGRFARIISSRRAAEERDGPDQTGERRLDLRRSAAPPR